MGTAKVMGWTKSSLSSCEAGAVTDGKKVPDTYSRVMTRSDRYRIPFAT